MGSRMRSGAVALALAVVVAVTGACGADNDEAPGAASGQNEADSEGSAGGGSGHSGGHEGRPRDKPENNDMDKDPGGSATTRVIEVEVAGGEVKGVGSSVAVAVGERVAIEVSSDTDDEVHVHGYDVLSPVSPSKPAQLSFVADLPGAWEVELENARLLLFELRVQ